MLGARADGDGRGRAGAAECGGLRQFSGIPAISLVSALLLILIGAVGEETGWRGYALPQLQRRFTPFASSLILAVLCADARRAR